MDGIVLDPVTLGLLSTILGMWVGSIEWRFRNMDARMRNVPDRTEVKESIDLHLESVRVMLAEIKEDVKEIRRKSDRD